MPAKSAHNFFHDIFHALRFRNYRLFFWGQVVSLTGSWIQQTAMSWLVYRMTHSALILGVIGFSNMIPSFVFAPVAGVLADRYDRRALLMGTQVLSMMQALVLAGLVLADVIAVWHVIGLSLFMGMVNALDTPVRQSFMIDMVESKAVLGNAIALNSMVFNGARLIGPPIAGLLIALTGEGVCFLINGITFLAVMISLTRMSMGAKPFDGAHQPVWVAMREGFAYVKQFVLMRRILIYMSLVSFFGMPYFVLMPVFAKDILQGGPHTLGLLMGATGLGAMTGALYLASRKSLQGLDRVIVTTGVMCGVAIMLFALSRELWWSCVTMFAAGIGLMVQMASSNTLLQNLVDDKMRGRVMSFFTMAFFGTAPLGSLLAGYVSDRVGGPATLFVAGLCFVGLAVFAGNMLNTKCQPPPKDG